MNATLKNVARVCVPPPIRQWWRRRFGWRWFQGGHATWAEARRSAAGYDDQAVLARVLAATREVRAGRARWERDGTTFQEPQFNEPLLAVLKGIAAAAGNRLELIDVGGALGSTWWQHRSALADLAEVSWRVVEQRHFVAAGAEFADRVLSFHASLEAALNAGGRPSVVLFSSVLPYLENPRELLAEAVRRGLPHVVVDRTPFAVDGRERIVVQRTPPELGGGSYPCWLFSRAKFLAWVEPAYALRQEWRGFDDVDPAVEFRGFHFQLARPEGAR